MAMTKQDKLDMAELMATMIGAMKQDTAPAKESKEKSKGKQEINMGDYAEGSVEFVPAKGKYSPMINVHVAGYKDINLGCKTFARILAHMEQIEKALAKNYIVNP